MVLDKMEERGGLHLHHVVIVVHVLDVVVRAALLWHVISGTLSFYAHRERRDQREEQYDSSHFPSVQTRVNGEDALDFESCGTGTLASVGFGQSHSRGGCTTQ